MMKSIINPSEGTKMKKSAFTMLELVFVIVVLGILAALALPRMDRDLRQEAADNVLSAIRYTQHLALNDDKTNPFDSTWQSELWNISFAANGSNYTVLSDGNFASDPTNGKLMDGTSTGSPNTQLQTKYGINSISGCNIIAFDHLGRPFTAVSGAGNDYGNYMSGDCNLTVSSPAFDSNITIEIKTETGYARIIGYGNDDS